MVGYVSFYHRIGGKYYIDGSISLGERRWKLCDLKKIIRWQLRFGSGDGVGIYRKHAKKNAENRDCVGILLLVLCYELRLWCVGTRTVKVERVRGRVMDNEKKKENRDRELERDECTPGHQSTLESSSIKIIYSHLWEGN